MATCNVRRNKNKLILVLIGRTGCGKSATGNFILGEQKFDSARRLSSKTKITSWGKCNIDETEMVVIDTPGVFDTAAVKDKDTERKIASEITKCVSIAASQGEGLDAFILILNADDRFTKEHAECSVKR